MNKLKKLLVTQINNELKIKIEYFLKNKKTITLHDYNKMVIKTLDEIKNELEEINNGEVDNKRIPTSKKGSS